MNFTDRWSLKTDPRLNIHSLAAQAITRALFGALQMEEVRKEVIRARRSNEVSKGRENGEIIAKIFASGGAIVWVCGQKLSIISFLDGMDRTVEVIKVFPSSSLDFE
ncbi:hypothetical protein TNCT_672561 [Trichonephila clavata]|uniref:Uncharacterized protein n=1 Tax=Trichonephila clavata TaxID=2740835 RepID=A0A8X6JLQ5_TRICU|nr:hypothetical protein TNCT_672561 [Trichonephila clavata]